MVVYFVEWYQVKKYRKQKYKALMKKIHRTLRKQRQHVPELLSYRTFEAGKSDSSTTFVEMFEFANQREMNRFFGRFSKTEWLRTLQLAFFELVPRGCHPMRTLTWSPFLKNEWPAR